MRKKLLIMLAALSLVSATSFGATGPDATTGESSIQVTTTLAVLGGGIIITPSPDGTSNEDIYLNHGSFQNTIENEESTVSKDVYVRQASGEAAAAILPAGFAIKVGLSTTNENNLLNGGNSIAHTLVATIGAGATPLTGTDKTVTISEGNTNVSKEFITNGAELPITVASTVAGGAITDATVPGPYVNTSTLKVGFAKTPATTR
ncbi:MAG: hypothetical protein ACRC4T_27335 [Cetobacterium sp.]